jgi:excisionase family DNA binding protein
VNDYEILTVKELAVYLKTAEKTAYRFASEDILLGFKVGDAWRFRKSEIDQWTKEHSSKVGAVNQSEK